jgi:hypothetical protein
MLYPYIIGLCLLCCSFSRYPAILARSVDALEAQLSGLAELLGADIQRAARLAFKVPALAAASSEELQEHMSLLERVSECASSVQLSVR